MTDGLIEQMSAPWHIILAFIGFTIAVRGWTLIMSAE
jgi:hypothetical protein